MRDTPSYTAVGHFLNNYFEDIQRDFNFELQHGINKSLKELNGENFFTDLHINGELETFLKLPESKKRKILKSWIEIKCKSIFSLYSERLSKLINRPFPPFTLKYSLRPGWGKYGPHVCAHVVQKSRIK